MGRKQTKRTFLFHVLTLGAVALALVSATFAWFITQQYSSADPFEIDTAEARNLQISGDGEDWAYHLSDPQEGRTLYPACGNGLSFFLPTYDFGEKTASGVVQRVVKEYRPMQTELKADFLYEMEFSVKIDVDTPLYVRSFSLSVGESGDTTPFGVPLSGVKGALRVALLSEENAKQSLVLMWVPAPEIELTYTDGSYFLNENSNNLEKVKLVCGSGAEDFVEIEPPEGGVGVTNFSPELPDPEADPEADPPAATVPCYFGEFPADTVIAQLSSGEVKQFRLVMWIDGNDRECNDALLATGNELNGMIALRLALGVDDKEG